jgi:hypothetical protein
MNLHLGTYLELEACFFFDSALVLESFLHQKSSEKGKNSSSVALDTQKQLLSPLIPNSQVNQSFTRISSRSNACVIVKSSSYWVR